MDIKEIYYEQKLYYLLVIMDNFSNYVWINVIKNKRTLTVIKYILTNWFSIFDVPEKIITDCG